MVKKIFINNKNQVFLSGFTLVEVLITVAIFTLIIIVILALYLTGQGFYQRGGAQAELLQNGRVILERISREVRQAKEIVTELSESEEEAASSIMFEDGHSPLNYYYIHYFQEENLIKREVIGYYFSGDPEQTLVHHQAAPPEGQTLETKILEEARVIGEYVDNLKIWGSKLISISLTLAKGEEALDLKTKILGRNL